MTRIATSPTTPLAAGLSPVGFGLFVALVVG